MRDSGVFLHLAHKAMIEMGIDTRLVWQRMRVTEELLSDQAIRTPHQAQTRFWRVLEEVSSDPNIGLHLAENMPVYKGQVLQYLFLSSPTLGDGLKRALNYQRLLSDAVNAELVEQGDISYLQLSAKTGGLDGIHIKANEVQGVRHLAECVLLGLVKFFQDITEEHFELTQVDFTHSEPEQVSEHQRLLGDRILFSQSNLRLYFPTSILSFPSSTAEPELLELHEKLASEHVAKLEQQDISERVKRVFAEVLESGDVTLESVSERLGIKPRTLRTKLSEADTSFNKLLAEYRCYLAKKLLAKTNETIDEIVYLTGFSEPSTFYRAFKNWTGMTPIEYRNERRNQA